MIRGLARVARALGALSDMVVRNRHAKSQASRASDAALKLKTLRGWLRRHAQGTAVTFVLLIIMVIVAPAPWNLELTWLLLKTVGTAAAALFAIVGLATLLHNWLSSGQEENTPAIGAGAANRGPETTMESTIANNSTLGVTPEQPTTFNTPSPPKVDSA
jgi:hypothetical protein